MKSTIDICDSNLYRGAGQHHPRLHAKSLDRDLGYRVSKIEMKLLQDKLT